jgi:FkbM family methyltransferase
MDLILNEKLSEEPLLCLNMIVKNEAHIIKDTLNKLYNKIKFDYWVISDTGSTDETKKVIQEFFKEKNINGEIYDDEWKDFGHNRTVALQHAYGKSKYVLIFDADDEIAGNFVLPSLTKDSYYFQFGSEYGVSYIRQQIVNNKKKWKYVGVLHEIITCEENNLTAEIIAGDYYTVSGRTSSRNKDENKYLKDALILEKAYNDCLNKNDDLYIRYGFYCANSFFDAGKYEDAIKWYKITLNNNNWSQEKYISCLHLFQSYSHLKNAETGFYYLVKSFEYDKERVECLYELVTHYCVLNLNNVAYSYYSIVKDYYETKYLSEGVNDKLFLDNTKADFYLPYYMIIVLDKIGKHTEAKNIFKIIFSKKYKEINTFYVGNLLYNLQFFIEVLKDDAEFIKMFQEYLDFLHSKNYPLHNHNFLSNFEKYGININYNIKAQFSDEECINSNKILIYTGYSPHLWNYTYSATNALGGSETAVLSLAKELSNNYDIYIAGNVQEETVNNIKFINLNNIPTFLKTYPINTIIVSRYINFYELYPYFSSYKTFIWGHDIVLFQYGTSLSVEQILEKWSTKINGCICQTNWHKTLFLSQYPQLTKKCYTINNGIDISLFPNKVNKINNRFIYTSCSERGLDRLLELWPDICEKIPDAELYISSYNPFPHNDYENNLNNIIKKYSNITHVGKLNKTELYNLMSTAEYWLYPTNFNETSCITAMEMLMSQVICIYYPIAGLVNTIENYGIPVQKNNEIETILNLTNNNKYELRKNGKNYALKCSWKNRSINWINLIFDKPSIEKIQPDIQIKVNSDEIFPNDIRFIYGTQYKNIDITEIISKNFVNNNKIVIPGDDNYRVKYFSDPNPGKKKYIYIKDANGNTLKTFNYNEDVIYNINRNFNTNSIKVINLKRRVDRKNQIIQQLNRENIFDYEIIEGIDGLDLQESFELYKLFERNNFYNKKGVIGCALSHIKLWNQLVNDNNNEYYVILEDDIKLFDNFKNKLEKHCELFQKYGAEHLSLGTYQCNYELQKTIYTEEIQIFEKDVFKFWNITFAYIISKSAAKKILEHINRCSIKCAIDNPQSYGCILTYHHTTHCIAEQKNVSEYGSDIINENCFKFNYDDRIEKLNICFIDWWEHEYCGGSFNKKDNFITDILKYANVKNIEIVERNENPDLIFHSQFGGDFLNYPNIRKIFYCGEPFPPRNNTDFNITFDKTEGKNYRFPLWLGYLNNYLLEECQRRKNGIITIPKRNRFCSMIAGGEFKSTCRREFVEKMSKYKRVDCGGRFLNNIGFTVPLGTNCSGKIEHNNYYKFATAFENEDHPGYVTEKICDIFKSNCIPIYIGNNEVIKDFNPKTFINGNDFKNLDDLIEYIIKVDNNDELYASYFNEPFFSNKWLDIFNDPNKSFYKNLADCIVGRSTNLFDNYFDVNKKKSLDKMVIYGPNWIYNLIEDYVNNLKTVYDISFVSNIDEIKNSNPHKILCINNIFDERILTEFKNIEISILNIDSLVIPYFLENILKQNYLYPNIKFYDYSKTNINIMHRNNISNTCYLEYNCDEIEVNNLKEINKQPKIYDFGIICYNKEMTHSKRRKDIVDTLKSNAFTVNVICGFGKERDIELGKCKIILNIHQQHFKEIECRTFENIRCNRLLYSDFKVLSEFSFVDNEFILRFPNLKFIKYDDFKNITRENIDTYDFGKLEIDKNNTIFSYLENNYINMTLEQIANNYITDKNTSHSYLGLYHNLLKNRRFSAKNILEIGIQRGGSLKLWSDYFINANIYGLDIDEAPTFLKHYDRIQTFKTSAYSLKSINMFINKNIYFDVILDDGPHTIESMIYALIHYPKLLAPNGILIIEDIPSMEWALLFQKIVKEPFRKNTNIYDLRENKGRWDDIVFTLINDTASYGLSIFDYKIDYGLDNIKEDITHTVLASLVNKNYLEIPKGDYNRFELFGRINPCDGIKKLFIYNYKSKNEIVLSEEESIKFDVFNSSANEIFANNDINNIKLNIYNIWHNKLFDKCYNQLDDYSLDKLVMYDVNPKYPKIFNKDKNYNIVSEYNLNNYNSSLQETNYCQTSCFYHIFKNKLHSNLDYIGFIQYDMILYKDFIYDIENKIKTKNKNIFFYSLLVPNKRDVKFICKPYDNSVLQKYNSYFNTNHSYESISLHSKSNNFIALHTFVIPNNVYIKLMEWYMSIHDWLNNNYLNQIYEESIAEITESIFGLFLLLQMIEDDSIEIEELKLYHEWPILHNQTEWDNYKICMPENVKNMNITKKYNLCFDIGANIGRWAIANSNDFNKIISVEASKNTFIKLSENIKQYNNIVALNYAVCSSSDEYVNFYYAESDVLSSLNEKWVNGSESRFKVNYTTEICKTISIDKLIEQYGLPEFIKIDVESYEFDCIKTLSKKIDILCFEWASENLDVALNCLNHLYKLGFTSFYIQMNSDEYKFRPYTYTSINNVKNILINTTPKSEWGMIWCK